MKKTAARSGRRIAASSRAVRVVPATLLAAALRAQSEGVFIATRRCSEFGLTILFANDSFCAITGHSAKDLVGRSHGFLHLERADLERLRHWLPKAQPGWQRYG